MSPATFKSLSRQFDTTREEIIARMRDRISLHQRTKLTQQEKDELIDIFISRLQMIDDADLIERLCEREIALLEEGYPAATVAKNYLPKYRKAIALAIEENRIKLNERNSHVYTYFKDGESHLTTEHWALTYLKYDRADYEKFARSTIASNNLKQDSLKAVNPDLYLEAVDSLLESSQPLELAIAIAATTGRRYSEVMARGDFSPTNHPYQIHFSGQLKKRGLRDDEYLIYTLVPAELVLDALERFRTHPEIAELENASISKLNQLNTPINRLVQHYFQDTEIVPVLVGEAGVTIQNLRGLYGEIAVHFFCPTEMGPHRFIQQRLGHLIADSDLASSKNSGSTEHYFHYYLVDSQGKQLSDKGVLLEQLDSSPKTIVEDRNGFQEESATVKQLELPTQDQNDSETDFTEPASGDDVLHDVLHSSSLNVLQEDSSTHQISPPQNESLPPNSDRQDARGASLPNNENQGQSDRSQEEKVTSFDVTQNKNESETIPLPQNSLVRERVLSTSTSNQTLNSSALNFPKFLAIIKTLIESDDYQHLVVGLMAATGLDAASLLKLLVFKEAAAPHLILYCQQLHPSHQPLQQLLTLLDADEVLDAIARLRRDRDAIDFAHRLTGEEINQAVQHFTPDVLESIGLRSDLNLSQQYRDLIPLVLKENISDRFPWSSLSQDTQSHLEQWQQHFQCDLDTTLNQLMQLATEALSSSPSQNNVRSPNSSSSVPLNPSTYSPSPPEPSPWLAISRLTEIVARLSDRIIEQNDRLMNFPSQNQGHSLSQGVSSHRAFDSAPRSRESKVRSSEQKHPSLSTPSFTANKATSILQTKPLVESDSAVDLEAFKKMSSEELKHSRAKGAPIEKLRRALDALMSFNQQQAEPKQMWRINTHLLQQLTGCFNSSVKTFVKKHQQLIDSHNQQFGLTNVRHNGVHKKIDPNDLIHW